MLENDIKMQKIYDEKVNGISKESFLINSFNPFEGEELYLVSGQNSYFNKHIEENGLNHIRLEDYDAKIITMLHSLVLRFGHPHNYGKNDSILYVAPPGTIELSYARQSFPSGILEDIFRWQGNKKMQFPWYTYSNDIESVELILGEKESDYWMRVVEKLLEIKIKSGNSLKFEDREISEEELENFKVRLHNVLKKFCTGKNRLYFLPLYEIMSNKISWFAENIREGEISGEDFEKEVSSMRSLKQIIDDFDASSIDFNEKVRIFLEKLKSSKSQWGLAILGEIKGSIKYVEVKTTYKLLQEYFFSHGYKTGDIINHQEIYKLFEEKQQDEIR